jgi:hypothetical protein
MLFAGRLRRVIVHVHRIPERRRGLPFRGTEPQPRTGARRGEIRLAERREPHRGQIAIRAVGDGLAVILADEHQVERGIRDAHIRLCAFVEKRVCGDTDTVVRAVGADMSVRITLTHVLRIQRQCGQWQRLSSESWFAVGPSDGDP